uniref:Uncharacterized protein n=1 Tax=Timema douglasi TaxID=61478 RepID=A0A7R8Z504_TIMDO|nr:unnamed protein product [Timema douglasi]
MSVAEDGEFDLRRLLLFCSRARGETVNGEVAPRPHGLGGGSNRRTQGGNMGVKQRGMLVATLWWGCMVWVWAEAASQTTQQCPPYAEINPCTCTVKKNGLDIVCEFTDLSHIAKAMSVLKGKQNIIIFYLKLRHNNLPKLQGFVFLGLEISHLTIHNSSLAVVEESSLSSIGKGLTQLDLSQNSLSTVPSNSFKNLHHLLILNMNHNKVATIHNQAFEGLDTLEILTLYENRLSNIDSQAFKGLEKKLRRLNLGGNELSAVPTEALSIMDTLKKLEMQENHITDIHEGDFEGDIFTVRTRSPSGVRRYSSGTPDGFAPADLASSSSSLVCQCLRNLDSLSLAHNHLKEVPARVFSHLTILNSLELEGNAIIHVDQFAFVGLEGK